MSSFTPSRASPPLPQRMLPKGNMKPSDLNLMDITISSPDSSAIIADISPEDMEIIDEIIERSPDSTTTFLTIFKAYNEVLRERGKDVDSDVVYYKLLLQLGSIRGQDWKSKWNIVKSRLDGQNTVLAERSKIPHLPRRTGFQPSPHSHITPKLVHTYEVPSRSFPSKLSISVQERESLIVHSHQNDVSYTTMEESDATEPTSSPTTLIQHGREPRLRDTASHLLKKQTSYPPLPSIDQFLPVQARHGSSRYSNISGESRVQVVGARSALPSQNPPITRIVDRHNNSSRMRDSLIQQEDPWQRVKMMQDEKAAVRFREIVLMERCFIVWRGSLHWIHAMETKVRENRNKATLSKVMGRWAALLQVNREAYSRACRKYNASLRSLAWNKWEKNLKEKKITKWRCDMRNRMAHIKAKNEGNLKCATWIRWRQSCQQHNQQHYGSLYYVNKLSRKCLGRWREALGRLGHLENEADKFLDLSDRKLAATLWEFWKAQTSLCELSRTVVFNADQRIVATIFRAWKQRLQDNLQAKKFRDRHIVIRFFHGWRQSFTRLHNLERKAVKYRTRENAILLRAVLRVWAARERGLLLKQAMKIRKLRSIWLSWKLRLARLRSNEGRAVTFADRISVNLMKAALIQWHQGWLRCQTLQGRAARYDNLRSQAQMLTSWRIQLRLKLQMHKNARVLRKYLLIRDSWEMWKSNFKERRECKQLELRLKEKYLHRWKTAVALMQRQRLIQSVISRRMISDALSQWTSRAIFVKGRELDVVMGRNYITARSCYYKWKSVFKRLDDDSKLMQSYQHVKREEQLRRLFTSWLTATKTSRYWRIVLLDFEKEKQLLMLERVWDRWREKYKAENLRPLAHNFTMQCQKTRLYQAFMVWHSRTKSAPAIRLYSTRAKANVWLKWRSVIPRALQARDSRIFDRKKVLGRALDKWTQSYRTKIALKAVARARYLRLPSGTQRQSLPLSSVLSGIFKSSQASSHGNSARLVLSDDEQTQEDIKTSSHRSRASRNVRPALRGTSSSPGQASDIWHELRRAHARLSRDNV